jgi:hypothetical protein
MFTTLIEFHKIRNTLGLAEIMFSKKDPLQRISFKLNSIPMSSISQQNSHLSRARMLETSLSRNLFLTVM